MKKNENEPGKKDILNQDKSTGGTKSQWKDEAKSPTGTPHPKEGKSTDRELDKNRKGVK